MVGMERANQASGTSRVSPLLLGSGIGGGKARGWRWGKREVVEHEGSGAAMMRYKALREILSAARDALTAHVFEWFIPGL